MVCSRLLDAPKRSGDREGPFNVNFVSGNVYLSQGEEDESETVHRLPSIRRITINQTVTEVTYDPNYVNRKHARPLAHKKSTGHLIFDHFTLCGYMGCLPEVIAHRTH